MCGWLHKTSQYWRTIIIEEDYSKLKIEHSHFSLILKKSLWMQDEDLSRSKNCLNFIYQNWKCFVLNLKIIDTCSKLSEKLENGMC